LIERSFMKRVLVLVVLLVVGAVAADVTGTWSGTFKVSGGDHSTPQLIILKQDGNKLPGSAGPDAGEQYPIENGKVEGDRVRFEVTSGEWRFGYDLKRAGPDEMKGDLELKSVGSRRTAVVAVSRSK
jgi:hypothetical protein